MSHFDIEQWILLMRFPQPLESCKLISQKDVQFFVCLANFIGLLFENVMDMLHDEV